MMQQNRSPVCAWPLYARSGTPMGTSSRSTPGDSEGLRAFRSLLIVGRLIGAAATAPIGVVTGAICGTDSHPPSEWVSART